MSSPHAWQVQQGSESGAPCRASQPTSLPLPLGSQSPCVLKMSSFVYINIPFPPL